MDLGWNAPELRTGVRTVAFTRVLAVPIFAAIALIQPETHRVAIIALAAPWMVWQLVQLRWFLGEKWATYPLPWLLALDVTAVGAGVALSGGAHSDMRWLALLVLFASTYILPPLIMGRLSLLMLFCAGTPVIVDTVNNDLSEREAVIYVIAGTMVVILNVLASKMRTQTTLDLRQLANRQRDLLAATTSGEVSRRRRISQDLHDTALQTMLAARQDLVEAEAGDREALEFAREGLEQSMHAVRRLVEDMDSSPLAGSLLPNALGSLAVRVMASHGLQVTSELDPEATSIHDELLYDLARGLIEAALGEGVPRHITISLARTAEDIVLVVAHDGPESTPAEREVVNARVESIGGIVRMVAMAEGLAGLRISVPAIARPSRPSTTPPRMRRV